MFTQLIVFNTISFLEKIKNDLLYIRTFYKCINNERYLMDTHFNAFNTKVLSHRCNCYCVKMVT